ncbi:MAG TPA: hypothetical protein VHD39_02630 [Acidimicrobiales bacterium]|nr:hypothetical protein [Acidimicrobiales bacterium]
MAITKVVIFPDDWNSVNEADRSKYTASAATMDIVLTLSPEETINPDRDFARSVTTR